MLTAFPPSTVNVKVAPANVTGLNVVLSNAINEIGWGPNPATDNLPSFALTVTSGPVSPLYLPAYDWSVAASTSIGGMAPAFLSISVMAVVFAFIENASAAVR